MGKYIDADRLRAKIEKIYKSEIQPWLSGVSATSAIYDYVLPLIDSLQQEQPSLPSNLDEAAEEYAYNNWEDNDYHTGASEGLPFDAIGHTEKCFKARAEWMAGQDKETIELAEEHAYLAGSVNEREKMMKEAVEWLKDNVKNYIVDIGVGYGEHGRNVELIVGGKCWDDFKKAMKED